MWRAVRQVCFNLAVWLLLGRPISNAMITPSIVTTLHACACGVCVFPHRAKQTVGGKVRPTQKRVAALQCKPTSSFVMPSSCCARLSFCSYWSSSLPIMEACAASLTAPSSLQHKSNSHTGARKPSDVHPMKDHHPHAVYVKGWD